MDAGKRNINEIFISSRILEVPFFQRSYVWQEAQWSRFLEDMEYVSSGNEPYFMGSLILKQQATDSASRIGDVRLVVDGQQRLTTLSILMKVLSLKLHTEDRFKWQFTLFDGRPVLQHNHNDEAAYNRIIKLTDLVDLSQQDGITKLYMYFKEHADPEKLNYDKICNLILFVGIDLTQNEDEQQIFDTINSLGVRLTTAELLKNYFFGREDLEAYRENWLNVFEKDEETRSYWDQEITTGRIHRTFIDLFFYSFLQIKIQDSTYGVSTEDKNRFSKVERLFDSYKIFVSKYCDGNKASLLSEIRDYAKVFQRVFTPAVLTEELSAQDGLKRINTIMFGLDTATLIPYVLFIEKNEQDMGKRNELYDYLESYIMRRLVTRQPTQNYNRLFSEKLILNRVLTRDELIKALSDINDTTNRMPTDAEVSAAFHESILTNKYAAGVLYMIESKVRNRSLHSTALLGLSRYSLEHMMPKKWRNHWDFEGTLLEKEARDRILLTLGNLTIITQSLNASIRDAAWEKKKKGDGSKGGLELYAAGLETLSSFLVSEEWNEEKIKERAEYLAETALRVWPAQNW